jgi:hypothetical protein
MNIWFRRLFLLVSIGGGFSGFAVTAVQVFQADRPIFYYVVCLAACAAYAFGVFAGMKFIEEEEEGLSLLSWYHLIQIPILASPVFSYQFTSGITAYVTLGNRGLSWVTYFGGQWQFSLFQLQDGTLAIGANFFAVWATWYLRKQLAKKRAKP